MNIYEIITATYPELTDSDFRPPFGSIGLRDDLDGSGIYIENWESSKPIPDGLKLGK